MTVEDLRAYEAKLLLASHTCKALDTSTHFVSPHREPWQLWPFYKAPDILRSLSTNGGDEDWILVVPNGEQAPAWAEEGQMFGCCTVEMHVLPCGRQVLIGCHA